MKNSDAITELFVAAMYNWYFGNELIAHVTMASACIINRNSSLRFN